MKRSKAITLLVAVILGTGLIATQAAEKKAEVKKQTTCPVMGGTVDHSQYVDVNGKRIYVCCPGCIAKVKADPDKYIKQLESEGVAIADAPKKEEAKKEAHAGHQH